MDELKIIITAANAAAKKAIKEVKDEIGEVQKKAKEGGKSISDSMKAVAKGAAIAVGAIAAVTTALVAFGKSTLEAQKNISKLNASFLAAGSSTKQASEVYKNLFRFMGDSGAATEAAQMLALITNNEKDLVEWTTILQGVYAAMGSTLPIESLAEAANETIKVGKVTGTMADALNWAGVSEDAFNAKLATTTSLSEREALVRSTLNSLYSNAATIYERNNQALLNHNASQAQFDLALARAGQAVLPLMTAVNNLATTLLNSLSPALAVICQMLAILVSWVTTAIGWITSFFSLFTGGKDSTKEVAESVSKVGTGAASAAGSVGGLGGALNKAAAAAKELKKQTMGFDELNVVSSQSEASSGGGGAAASGGGGGIAMPDLSSITENMPNLDEFNNQLKEARGIAEAILALVLSIGAAILIWKLGTFLMDLDKVKTLMTTVGGKIQMVSGILLIVAGAILTVKEYSDAWINGIDWGNFAGILAGIGLTVGGLALAFGTVAAGVGLLAGGIAILVLGIKDLIDNGFSVEAMLAVVTGVILTCVAAVLVFNAALLANPITWVVIAIAALVAAIAVCIVYWDDVKAAAVKAWEWIKEKWGQLADWFNQKVIQPIVKFFTNLWSKITEIFGKVKDWFSEKFTQAWEGIKNVFSGTIIGDYFKMVWENIKLVFSVVKSVLTGNFSDAWEGIKKIFSNVGTFFGSVWDKIKNTFSKLGTSIGSAISNAVKSGINGVISMIEKTINNAINLINGAITLINKIPGVSIGKINKLSLPRLARGGVVDSATIAMIGEAGKEAVVPLENNTEWMDKLADRLAERNQAPSKIVLMVDGKELGWASVNGINKITKQTGTIPLQFA